MPFYPFFLWIYSILAYGATNLGQASPLAVIRPLLLLFIVSLVLMFVHLAWIKSSHRAAFLTAGWGILFSAYGHIYLRIENLTIGNFIIGRHRYLLTLWILLAVLLAWAAKKIPMRFDRTTKILNQVSLILVLMPVTQGIVYFVNEAQVAETSPVAAQTHISLQAENATMPDIYYLVLDSYDRQDLLQDKYLYDNSEFIGFLQSKGFYVASCSQSNYNHTWFSVSTALNLNYLDQLVRDGKPARPVPLIKHSLVRNLLENLGYRMVAFETGYDFTDVTDADIYLHANRSWDLSSIFSAPINAAELMYLRTTAVTAVLELNGISEDQIELTVKKDMMNYIYTELPKIPKMDGPKLIYAHINTTHPPFIYSYTKEQRAAENLVIPDLVNLSDQTRKYRESIIYSNQKMEKIINEILDRSETPPIILIQGDHASYLKNDQEHMFDILNAYYFPDQDYSRLYARISPVNSFRVILNQFFNGDFPLIEDASYYSDTRDTWNFTKIENHCEAEKSPSQ